MTEKIRLTQSNALHWFPCSCVGIHIVQSLELGLHSHAGAWERGEDISNTEQALAGLIDELTGDEFDMQGLAELKDLLQGE